MDWAGYILFLIRLVVLAAFSELLKTNTNSQNRLPLLTNSKSSKKHFLTTTHSHFLVSFTQIVSYYMLKSRESINLLSIQNFERANS